MEVMDRKKFYSEKFAQNIRISGASHSRLKRVLSIFSVYHCDRLLDIGCGDGSFAVLLKDFADEVFGVDVSKDAVALAERRGITAFGCDVDREDLPFEDNFFDAIFCGEVIEHLYNPDHLLDEMYRVLKDGGICIITTPNLGAWYNRFLLLLGFQPHFTEVSLTHNVGKLYLGKVKDKSACATGGHIHVFTHSSLRELIRLHNFYIKNVFGADMRYLFPFPLNLFERLLSKKASLSSCMIFFITK